MLTKFIPYLRFAPYAGIALFALLAVVQWQSARHWEKRYVGSEKAHSATKAAYTGAQAAAQELNKAKVAQIEREYAANKATNRSTKSTGTSQSAPVPIETVSGAETAIIPLADLEIVADAYAQLDALRVWALDVGKVK